jgi:hypothetical protein
MINGINLLQGKNKYDPYVALGINLNEDESDTIFQSAQLSLT